MINLNAYKGKYILFVNVASYCGYTGQYADLQKLSEQYDNLEVIGLPCNQFLFQEPFSASTIKKFCSSNYGVTFLMTEKISVKGKNQHNIYKWLNYDKNWSKNFNSLAISLNEAYIELIAIILNCIMIPINLRKYDNTISFKLQDLTIREAWHSEKLKKIRELHSSGYRKKIEACKNCHHGAVKYGAEYHPKEWDEVTQQWKEHDHLSKKRKYKLRGKNTYDHNPSSPQQ